LWTTIRRQLVSRRVYAVFTGKLEKVIEEHGGDMILGREVGAFCLMKTGRPVCCWTTHDIDGRRTRLLRNGLESVRQAFGRIPHHAGKARLGETSCADLSSVVLYAEVDRAVIPEDTAPVEMLVGNPAQIDEAK
jgi:prolycopene isomerase